MYNVKLKNSIFNLLVENWRSYEKSQSRTLILGCDQTKRKAKRQPGSIMKALILILLEQLGDAL